MGVLVLQSIRGEHFVLENYALIFSDSSFRQALFNSLGLSAGVALLSTLLCLMPAWVFAKFQIPGKAILRAIFTIPLSFSGVIVGFLMIFLFGRIGFIPQLLEQLTGYNHFSGIAYQFSGLLLAYLYFEIPRATLSLESAISKMDAQLENASYSLGASVLQTFLWIRLPLLFPAILQSFAITFSASLGSFGVALILSKRISFLSLELFEQYIGFLNLGLAAAMAVTLVLISILVNIITLSWSNRLGYSRSING